MMEVGSETFVVEFFIDPAFVSLNPETWESACWDHALTLAHERGKIPVGPILITTEEVSQQPLTEGVPMAIQALLGPQRVLKVTASCMIGAEV